jgi:hypothetical protein
MALLTEITVADRDAAWQAEAVVFSACIYQGRSYVRGDYRTMAEAGAVATFLTQQAQNARKAMVYAITAEGHATLVPEAAWQAALADGLAAEDAAR